MTLTTDTGVLNGYAYSDAPDDTVPPADDVEYPCQVCGREAGPYGGRGPKPKFCDDHKKSKAKSGGTSSAKVTGSASSLAAQAATVLEQLNGIMSIGALVLGMHNTASAIAAATPGFKEQAYTALTTDPELCRLILKSGVKSGKVSLMIAYGSFAMQVAPVAVMEYKVKMAEKRQAQEEAMAAMGEDATRA